MSEGGVTPLRSSATKATAVVVAAAVCAALLLYGIGGRDAGSVVGSEELAIGIVPRMPGQEGGDKSFDADVAAYIAGRLGVAPDDVTIRGPGSEGWEAALADGTLDLVVGAFAISPESRERATLAGPYYVPHQDLLVRAGDESIRNVRDLHGRRVCRGPGDDRRWARITEDLGVPAVAGVRAGSYRACVNALAARRVDAVTADDVVLARLAATGPAGIELANAPFTDERYGVGLRKGDVEGCLAVNRIITELYQNGAAETLLEEWFGPARLEFATTVPRFEGCS